MFFGTYNHSLDEKGRIILPARLREALADGLFVTKSFDGCLSAYAKKDWLEEIERMDSLEVNRKDVRSYQRFVLGSAWEVEVSRQGRISIPQSLRDYAGLDKEIVIVGVRNKLEIWAKERYEQIVLSPEEAAEIAEEIARSGA